MLVMNLVALKAVAKHEHLFSKQEVGLLNFQVELKQHNKVRPESYL